MTWLTQLFIASTSPNKIKELKAGLESGPFYIMPGECPPIEETGSTFEENAKIKAITFANQLWKPALGDDSGLCIHALDGAPGIFSNRWKGDSGTYEEAFQKIKDALDKANTKDFSATFVCALAHYEPISKKLGTFEGRVEGEIVFPPRGHNGFGYDSIFVPKGSSKTFAEMTFEEKMKCSHRTIALQKLVEWFVKFG